MHGYMDRRIRKERENENVTLEKVRRLMEMMDKMYAVSVKKRKEQFQFLENSPLFVEAREWAYPSAHYGIWQVLQYVYEKEGERMAIDIPLTYEGKVAYRGEKFKHREFIALGVQARQLFEKMKKERNSLREMI